MAAMKRKINRYLPRLIQCLPHLSWIILFSCTHQVIVQDNKVKSEGLYEADAPGDGWIRLANLGGTYRPGFSLTDDIMSFQCPGEKMIGISRALYQHRPGKGRIFFPSTDDFARYFFEDYNENSGFTIQEIISSRTFQLAEHTAIEFEYLISGTPRLCTQSAANTNLVKSRVIVLKEGQSLNPLTFGQLKFIVFIFRSSPEVFDQTGPEFDRMVQSFTFIK